MDDLPDAILKWLRDTGREDHGECARCNERSRPASAPPESREAVVVARLLSHEDGGGGWRGIDEEELARVIARRRELDLFLNARDEEAAGYLAGRRDLRGNYKDVYLMRTDAQIIAELVEARKPIKANAMACLRKAQVGSELETAVRMVQRARQAVDVHALVRGRESRKKWRAIHTVGEKNATAFWFQPPGGLRWRVVLAS